MKKSVKYLILGAIVIIFGIKLLFDIPTIRGNEMGVLETWSGGVSKDPLYPKTYIFFPGFLYKVYVYDMGRQVFVMNNKGQDEEFAEGRKVDAYLVQSKEGQDMNVSLNIQWSRDPKNVVYLHKTVRDNVEERLIRPLALRVVKDEATKCSALEAYSGEGLVNLQTKIFNILSSPNGDLAKAGIIVHNFVIEGISLDKKYVDEIKDKQVAIQRNLKNIEQTKAAQSAAEKAKAEAQADYEKAIVEARRDKEQGILMAEKQAQQQILAAEAEKKKNILLAEGEKEAALNRADAIKAIGEAEAAAQKLKLGAYAVPGADAFVKIEVSKSLSHAYSGIKGYLPESMNLSVLSENYDKALSIMVPSKGDKV